MIATIQPGREERASTEVGDPAPATFSTTRVIVKMHTPGFRIGHKNQFVAFNNNPVNFTDAFGLLTDEQLKELGQHMQRSSKEFERIQLGYLGIMGAAVAAPSAGPAIANVARAGATKLLAGGAALMEAGRNALSRLAAWQPFSGLIHRTSIQGSYVNPQIVTTPSATFAELSTRVTPAVNAIANDITPAGPSVSSVLLEEWPAGFPHAIWNTGENPYTDDKCK